MFMFMFMLKNNNRRMLNPFLVRYALLSLLLFISFSVQATPPTMCGPSHTVEDKRVELESKLKEYGVEGHSGWEGMTEAQEKELLLLIVSLIDETKTASDIKIVDSIWNFDEFVSYLTDKDEDQLVMNLNFPIKFKFPADLENVIARAPLDQAGLESNVDALVDIMLSYALGTSLDSFHLVEGGHYKIVWLPTGNVRPRLAQVDSAVLNLLSDARHHALWIHADYFNFRRLLGEFIVFRAHQERLIKRFNLTGERADEAALAYRTKGTEFIAELERRVGFKFIAKAFFNNEYDSLAQQLRKKTRWLNFSTVDGLKKWMKNFVQNDTHMAALLKKFPQSSPYTKELLTVLTNPKKNLARSRPLDMNEEEIKQALVFVAAFQRNNNLDMLSKLSRSRVLNSHPLEMNAAAAWMWGNISKVFSYQAGKDSGIYSPIFIPPQLQTPLYREFIDRYGVKPLQGMVKALNSYIKKQAAYVTARSFHLTWLPTNRAKLYYPGNIVKESFFPTTRDEFPIARWVKHFFNDSGPVEGEGQSMRFTVIGESGADITRFANQHLDELLYSSGTEFLVVKRENTTEVMDSGEPYPESHPGYTMVNIEHERVLVVELGLAQRHFDSMNNQQFFDWLQYHAKGKFDLSSVNIDALRENVKAHASAEAPSEANGSHHP